LKSRRFFFFYGADEHRNKHRGTAVCSADVLVQTGTDMVGESDFSSIPNAR